MWKKTGNKLVFIATHLTDYFANLDIRVKIIGLAVGSVLVLGMVATLFTYSITSQILAGEVLHESTETAEELSEEIVELVQAPTLAGAPATVQMLLNATVSRNSMVTYAFISEAGGGTIFSAANSTIPASAQDANSIPAGQQYHVAVLHTPNGRVWDVAHAISGQPNDVVRIGYSEKNAKARLIDVVREQITVTAGMALVTLVVAYLLGSFLARQIKVLAQAACAVAKGEVGHQVKVFSRDALGRLAHAFNEMSDKLAETKGELEKRESMRRNLLVKIIKSQEDERLRVARDLHDNLGGTMSSLGYKLESASWMLETDPTQAKSIIDSLRDDNIRAQHELRTTIYALRPSVLDDLGLIPALESYAKTRLTAEGIDFDFETTGKPRRFSPEIETALFRIGQEALNNVVRHAAAQNVHVTASFDDGAVMLNIEDDGRGFDAPVLQNKPGEQVGLLGMRERAELLGGRLIISSKPGHGCRISIRVPLSKDKKEELWKK